jgi:hypothetical protein
MMKTDSNVTKPQPNARNREPKPWRPRQEDRPVGGHASSVVVAHVGCRDLCILRHDVSGRAKALADGTPTVVRSSYIAAYAVTYAVTWLVIAPMCVATLHSPCSTRWR